MTADDLRARLTALEQQLAQQTQRRDEAQFVLQQSQSAILQLQGAIALARELLTPVAVVPAPQNGAPDDAD